MRERGLPVAVGGSALLASLDRVRDWDITCEGEPAVVTAALDRLGLTWTARALRRRPRG